VWTWLVLWWQVLMKKGDRADSLSDYKCSLELFLTNYRVH